VGDPVIPAEHPVIAAECPVIPAKAGIHVNESAESRAKLLRSYDVSAASGFLQRQPDYRFDSTDPARLPPTGDPASGRPCSRAAEL